MAAHVSECMTENPLLESLSVITVIRWLQNRSLISRAHTNTHTHRAKITQATGRLCIMPIPFVSSPHFACVFFLPSHSIESEFTVFHAHVYSASLSHTQLALIDLLLISFALLPWWSIQYLRLRLNSTISIYWIFFYFFISIHSMLLLLLWLFLSNSPILCMACMHILEFILPIFVASSSVHSSPPRISVKTM